MIDSKTLRGLDKDHLLQGFSRLVDEDRRKTATLIAYIAEIDRRKLYLELAYPSMFAFCTERFGMSEAIAHKRIRGGRAASRFPRILGMLARGEIHLTGVHQLASHLTEENHKEVLERAKHKSMREIQKLVAELAPKPDVPSLIRALPNRRASMPLSSGDASSSAVEPRPAVQSSGVARSKPKPRPIPLSPRRYKLQVTIGQETRDKLEELQGLLSHQIPNGDPAEILDRALDSLLVETKKKKAALTNKPRSSSKKRKSKSKSRGIPARVRREFSSVTRGSAPSSMTEVDGAARNGRSSFIIGCRMPWGVRTTPRISSSAAGRTINGKPSSTLAWGSWMRDGLGLRPDLPSVAAYASRASRPGPRVSDRMGARSGPRPSTQTAR